MRRLSIFLLAFAKFVCATEDETPVTLHRVFEQEE